MKVVIAGGSGFLGSALASALLARHDDVVVFSRRAAATPGPVRRVVWRPDTDAPANQFWARELDSADAIVNLAGAGIADRRWTRARKQLLRDSRIVSTQQLVTAIRAVARRPSIFLQASGIGYYGTAGDEVLDESSPAGSDFLAALCRDWEHEAAAAAAFGCRVVTIRNGIVLDRRGGALKKMRLPFQLGLGGPIASGRQYFSWIHIDDWVAMALWAIDTAAVTGALNATAPAPVTNAGFSRALGAALHRPAALTVPAFALRLLVGELADAGLITGQRVVPTRALGLGFQFKYAEIGPALAAALA